MRIGRRCRLAAAYEIRVDWLGAVMPRVRVHRGLEVMLGPAAMQQPLGIKMCELESECWIFGAYMHGKPDPPHESGASDPYLDMLDNEEILHVHDILTCACRPYAILIRMACTAGSHDLGSCHVPS